MKKGAIILLVAAFMPSQMACNDPVSTMVVHDTVTIYDDTLHDTINLVKYDSLVVRETLAVVDTIRDTLTQKDTIIVQDTVMVDTLFVPDTVRDTLKIWVHDTTVIWDTLEVVSVDTVRDTIEVVVAPTPPATIVGVWQTTHQEWNTWMGSFVYPYERYYFGGDGEFEYWVQNAVDTTKWRYYSGNYTFEPLTSGWVGKVVFSNVVTWDTDNTTKTATTLSFIMPVWFYNPNLTWKWSWFIAVKTYPNHRVLYKQMI